MIVLRRFLTQSYLKYYCSISLDSTPTPRKISNPEASFNKVILQPVQIPQTVSLKNLANLLQVDEKEILRTFKLVAANSINFSAINQEQIDPILPLFNSYLAQENPVPRPPIVTIMGHVDHGKTTLLDTLRNSSIAAGEVGGITQKIGAFHVKTPQGMITFIDTPGHEAFSNMRQRGASFTDLIILVVSAADGVQPQTKEVIEIAHNLQIPMIVAVNKIDLMGVNPEDIEAELVELGLELESHGGNIPVVHISAKTGKNVDLLLELIQFQGELLDLKADPNIKAQGFVLEARQQELEEERGSTLIVQKGCLRVGDVVVIGCQYGKVRTMKDDRGNSLTEALPSYAVEIIGLKEVPQAGEKFFVTNELLAKLIVQNRKNEQQQKFIESAVNIDGTQGKIKFENRRDKRAAYSDPQAMRGKFQEMQDHIMEEIEQTEDPETLLALSNKLEQHRAFTQQMVAQTKKRNGLNIIVKGSDFGTLETMKQVMDRVIKESGSKVNIISSSIGDVTPKDVKEAQLFEATILGLNVKVPADQAKLIQSAKIQMIQHQIIYHLIDDLKKLLAGDKAQAIEMVGTAKVLNIFDLKIGKGQSRRVYGLQVQKGYIQKKSLIRVLREGRMLHTDLEIVNLKHFKEEVPQVEQGKECGVCLAANVEIKVNDIFEIYQQ